VATVSDFVVSLGQNAETEELGVGVFTRLGDPQLRLLVLQVSVAVVGKE